jgi:hypothetical protein
LFALIAGARHVFENNSNRIGVAVAVAASAPILLFVVWFEVSGRFRKVVLSLDPRILTFAQTWRVLGAVFVVLESFRLLPAVFAWPAGYGDIAIGLTAPFVAWKLTDASRRGSFILWQLLGITDLVFAVGLGTTARLLSPDGASMAPMTMLPLSLVPTFLVPLFLIFHVISIMQARKWNEEVSGRSSKASGTYLRPCQLRSQQGL